MPEIKKSPKQAFIEFQSESPGGKKSKRKGPDLDSTLRGVILELKESHNLSTASLARKMGVRQQTLSTFMSPGETQGCRLALLSRLCAAFNLTPIEIFQISPFFAEDHASVAASLKADLDKESWVQFLELVVVGQALSITDVWIEQAHTLVMSFAESQNRSTKALITKARKLA